MLESNKYIFLDFDGVLNTEQYQAECAISNLPSSDKYGLLFDPRAVKNLERIIHETSAKIVVTSTWRFIHNFETIRRMWSERQLPGKLLDVLPSNGCESRGDEIFDWLHDKNCLYVIIDDVYDFLPSQQNNVIEVNSIRGLSKKEADKAISILNGKQ